MYTLLIVIHLLACFVMVGVILLQSGKGAEIGAAFGGSSQTLFGSRGATTFLSKVTVVAAVIFMLTALSLAVLSKERSVASSIIELQQTGGGSSPSESAPPPKADASGGGSTPTALPSTHEQPHSQESPSSASGGPSPASPK